MAAVLDVHGRIPRRSCFAVCRGPVTQHRPDGQGPWSALSGVATGTWDLAMTMSVWETKEARQIGIVSMARTQTTLKTMWKRALHRTARDGINERQNRRRSCRLSSRWVAWVALGRVEPTGRRSARCQSVMAASDGHGLTIVPWGCVDALPCRSRACTHQTP